MAYTCSVEELDELLKGLPENNVDTPYEIKITDANDANFRAITYHTNSISEILYNNPTKFVDLEILDNPDLANIVTTRSCFENVISLVRFKSGVLGATDGWDFFAGCTNLQYVDTNCFFNLTITSGLFARCTSLQTIKWGFDVRNLTDHLNNSFMFEDGVTTIHIEPFEVIDADYKSPDSIITWLDEYHGMDINHVEFIFEGELKTNTKYLKTLLHTLEWNWEDEPYHISILDANATTFKGGTTTTAGTIQEAFDGLWGVYVALKILDNSSINSMTTMAYALSGISSLVEVEIERPLFSAVKSTAHMFENCTGLRKVKLGEFSAVTDISYMFNGCHRFVELDGVGFVAATNATSAFAGCTSLVNVPWLFDTSKLTTATGMFDDQKNLNVQLGSVIIASQTSANIQTWFSSKLPTVTINITVPDTIKFKFAQMDRIFSEIYTKDTKNYYLKLIDGNATTLAQPTSSATGNIGTIFSKYWEKNTKITFELEILNNTTLPTLTSLQGTFNYVPNVTKIIFPEMPKITTIKNLFSACTLLTDVNMDAFPSITNIDWFCSSTGSTLNLHRTDFSKVTSASNAFARAGVIEGIEAFDFSSLENATHMFYFSRKNSFNLSSFKNVKDASYMFEQCVINKLVFPKDNKITTAVSMFDGAKLYEVSPLDFPLLTNANCMFRGSTINQDSLIINAPLLTNASSMFYSANLSTDDLDISSFKKVTNTSEMFYNCTNLNITWGFDTSKISTYTKMFNEDTTITVKNVNLENQAIQNIRSWLESKFSSVNFDIDYIFPLQHSGPSTCQTILEGLPENTPETPYELWATDLYPDHLENDSSTPKSGTYQYALKQNLKKYVSLDLTYKLYRIERLAPSTNYAFTGCTNLVFFRGTSRDDITSASEMFNGCTKLTSVEGDFMNKLTSMDWGFASTGVTAIDTTQLSELVSANYLFHNCKNLKNIDTYGLENVLYAKGMFDYSGINNVNLRGLINVEDAENLFSHCSFITSIDMSMLKNVLHTRSMFDNCTSLGNVILPDKLITDDATNMFFYCTSLRELKGGELFIQKEAKSTFSYTQKLQKLDVELHLEEALDLYGLFYNSNISDVDLSTAKNATKIGSMFWYCRNLNHILWGIDVNKVEDSDYMFQSSSNNIYIEIPRVETTGHLKQNVKAFLNDEEKFSVYYSIPLECSRDLLSDVLEGEPENSTEQPFKIDIYDAQVSDMQGNSSVTGLFQTALNDNPNKYVSLGILENEDIPANIGTRINYIFYNCPTLVEANFPVMENVKIMQHAFQGCTSLREVNMNQLPYVEDIYEAFKDCISLKHFETVETNNLTSVGSAFANCTSLESVDTSGFANTTSLYETFMNCTSLEEIDTSHFDKVTSLQRTFSGCTSLKEIDTSHFHNVTRAESFAQDCTALEEIDMGNFVNLTAMYNAFMNCTNLKVVHNFNFSPEKIATMSFSGAFENCPSLTSIFVPSKKVSEDGAYKFIHAESNYDSKELTYEIYDYSSKRLEASGTIPFTKADIYVDCEDGCVDEFVSSTPDVLTDTRIEAFMDYRNSFYANPSVNVLDPSGGSLVFWAKNPSNFVSNIDFGGGGGGGSSAIMSSWISVESTNNKYLAPITLTRESYIGIAVTVGFEFPCLAEYGAPQFTLSGQQDGYKPIKVAINGELQDLPTIEADGSTPECYWKGNTALTMIFTGEYWLVINPPAVYNAVWN